MNHRGGGNEPDLQAARELDLYAENEGALYGQYKSILKNLLRKVKSGTYDKAKAPAIWMYWYEAAAKKYAREFGSSPSEWSTMFTRATRLAAARDRAADEYNRMKSGEHDYLLSE